jgi:hypothetical protein
MLYQEVFSFLEAGSFPISQFIEPYLTEWQTNRGDFEVSGGCIL